MRASSPHAMRIHEHLQEALGEIEDLQRAYDKLVDDAIIIAAELGAEPSYDGVIARIRRLRQLERFADLVFAEIGISPSAGDDDIAARIKRLRELERDSLPEVERRAYAKMINRMETAASTPKSAEDLAADAAAEATYLAANPELVPNAST